MELWIGMSSARRTATKEGIASVFIGSLYQLSKSLMQPCKFSHFRIHTVERTYDVTIETPGVIEGSDIEKRRQIAQVR